MPPKQRITKEMILERAFEMFSREGMGVINARSVAKALNCSTQPIFSYYAGMEDLKKTLEQKARTLFVDALKGEETAQQPLVQFSCAYVNFAAKEPQLYLHLCTMDDPYFPLEEAGQREEMIRREAACSGMDAQRAEAVCGQMSIFVLGLATARATGKAQFTQEQANAMIDKLYTLLTK